MRKDISGVFVSVIAIITCISILHTLNMYFVITALAIGTIVAGIFCWIILKNESTHTTDTYQVNHHKDDIDIAHLNNIDNALIAISNKEKSSEYTPICLSEIPAPYELVGRKREIHEISVLQTESFVVCLRGEAGIGKTAIASSMVNTIKENCHYEKYKYKHVAWIQSSGNIVDDFMKLDIPGTDLLTDTVEKKKHIIKWLQQNPTFIVINELKHILGDDETEFLNTIAGITTLKIKSDLTAITSVLITTRVEITQFREYILKPLPKKDAIKLFKKNYYRDTPKNVVDDLNIKDEKIIAKLVKIVAYNPLLIELLSKQAYWKHQSLNSVMEYVNDFSNNSLENQKNVIREKIAHLYQMANLTDGQREILEFFTIFQSEKPIFFDIFKLVNISPDDLKYLTEHGWIIRTENGYIMHSIVKNSVRLQSKSLLKKDNLLENKQLMEYLVNTDLYMPLTSGYKNTENKIHILKSFCDYLKEYILIDTNIASLFNSLGHIFLQFGDNERAFEYCSKALEARKVLLGVNHIDTAESYINVASSYFRNCNYTMALEYYKKALEIQEKVLGTNNTDTAITYTDIAIAYIKQCNYDEANHYYDKALNSAEKGEFISYFSQTVLYSNLGLIAHSICRYIDSMKYYKKALSICEREIGIEHPLTALTYNDIACLYQELGRYFDALKYYRKALFLREKLLGQEHPDTATSYNNLASLYQDLGHEQDAFKCYNKALITREKILGKNHLDTAIVYKNLSYLFCDQGDYELAQSYCMKALHICKKTVGSSNIETAKVYFVLAKIYSDQGDYEKALQYCSYGAEICEKILKDIHIEKAKSYNCLAIMNGRLKKYEKAKEYCLAALDIFKNLLGKKHPEVGKTFVNLAFLDGSQEHFDKAVENCLVGLEILLNTLGDEHPETATAFNDLAIFYNEQGNYIEALRFCKKARAIRESLLGKDHPDTARTYSTLAIIYKKLGDNDKAIHYYLKMKSSKGFKGMGFSNSDVV